MTARFVHWLFSGNLDRLQALRDAQGAVLVIAILLLLLATISLFETGGPLSSQSLLGTLDDKEQL